MEQKECQSQQPWSSESDIAHQTEDQRGNRVWGQHGPQLVFVNKVLLASSTYTCMLSCLFLFLKIHLAALSLSCSTWELQSSLWHSGSFFNCGMWDLAPWPGVKPRLPAMGAHSPGHWTTRDVPCFLLYILSMPAFLLFRHSLGVTENTWPVKLKMSAAYKMGCWNDTPCGGWNKKTTWKAMVWHGRVTSRGTEAARARLGKVTGMTRSGQASHHLKLVVLAIYAE